MLSNSSQIDRRTIVVAKFMHGNSKEYLRGSHIDIREAGLYKSERVIGNPQGERDSC